MNMFGKRKCNVVAAERRSGPFPPPWNNILCLIFPLYHWGVTGTFVRWGNSQKTEHLKVIGDKASDPSPMHDIQSEGHTWLLCNKNTSSSNSCWCIVVSVGDMKTLPMPFRSFQCCLILGWLLTGPERDLLFVFGLRHWQYNGVIFIGLFYSINHILDKENGCANLHLLDLKRIPAVVPCYRVRFSICWELNRWQNSS